MYIANLVGIRVFVTGGIGGVHRGVEETMDISADLTELGRTPVAVVCAGVKSILDIPRTLEYLETQGVTVAAYGTEEFPAFFTRKSGVKAPLSLDTPLQCAKLVDANGVLGMDSGIVFGIPIPTEFVRFIPLPSLAQASPTCHNTILDTLLQLFYFVSHVMC
jgi:pseudouridine-5'-phosphate glycosidase